MATMTTDPKLDQLPAYSERPVDPPAYTLAGSEKRKHWRRYRWWYIFVIICVILVITIPIMYVFYPRGRDPPELGKLNVTSVTLSSASYKNGGSVRITADYTTNSTSEVELQPWKALVAFDRYNKPGIDLPGFTARNRSEYTYDLQPRSRDDVDRFINVFCNSESQAGRPSLSVTLDGKGNTAPLNGVPSTQFSWRTTSPLRSLSNCRRLFPEVSFEAFNRSSTNGTNASGGLTFINDSIFRMDFGTLTLQLSHYYEPYANITIPNANLWTGNYTLPFTASINFTQLEEVYKYQGDLDKCALRPARLSVIGALGDDDTIMYWYQRDGSFWKPYNYDTTVNFTAAWAREGISQPPGLTCS